MAGWTAMGITTRAFSVRRTLIPWTPLCAAGPAPCGTAARPWTHGWTKEAAPMIESWRTRSLQPVS